MSRRETLLDAMSAQCGVRREPSYEWREELGGQWRQGPHPDVIFRDESDQTWAMFEKLIADRERALDLLIPHPWPEGRTLLAVDPGTEPTTIVRVFGKDPL